MLAQRYFTKQLSLMALLCFVFKCINISAIPTGIISAVYNLRVAETSLLITEEFKVPFGLDFTFFETERWQKKDKCQNKSDRSNAIGELFTFLYMRKPLNNCSWYIRGDFAFGRVSETASGKLFSKIEMDDFLVTGGYSWLLHSIVRCTFSGLLGIPFHKDNSLNRVQLGLGHLAFGLQYDVGINYCLKKCSVHLAARLIGSVPRSAKFQSFDYNYNLGEIIDLFIAHYSLSENHSFEFGYNPTFVLASGLSPHNAKLESELNLIRNSYYAAYEYNLEFCKMENAVEIGLSFSSDVIPKRTGQQLIIFGWLTWDISF